MANGRRTQPVLLVSLETPVVGSVDLPSAVYSRQPMQPRTHREMSHVIRPMSASANSRRARLPTRAGVTPTSIRLIRDIYAEAKALDRPVMSIELFPPKTEKGNATLFDRTLPALQALGPDFYSVTYGAGGSTRDKTLELADAIQRRHQTTTMAHLTCISTPLADIGRYLDAARSRGIRNILALRGDPPQAPEEHRSSGAGFEYSYQLVEFIRERSGFSIGTAGFPESHIACTEGRHVDWQRLKAKIDHGADFVLTQLFFDNDDYFAFRDYLVGELGVDVPLTPGVLPILSREQITRFAALCGATLPSSLLSTLESFGDDTAAVADFGAEFASRQCEVLLAGGAPGIHLYSLNRPEGATAIFEHLGLTGRS